MKILKVRGPYMMGRGRSWDIEVRQQERPPIVARITVTVAFRDEAPVYRCNRCPNIKACTHVQLAIEQMRHELPRVIWPYKPKEVRS